MWTKPEYTEIRLGFESRCTFPTAKNGLTQEPRKGAFVFSSSFINTLP